MNARCKHGVGTLTTLPQRPMQHSTPRDRPAARNPANHQSGRCVDARRARRQRCARCCLRLIPHCKHAVESLTTLQQRPMHTRRLETSQPLVTANHQAVAAQVRGGQVGGVASGGRLHGNGVAILYRLPASVALGSHQNRRSRNWAQGIQNLNTLGEYSESSGQNAKSARRANRA